MLICAEELAGRLADPDVLVVEVDVSSAAFDEWHIDGAVLWNVYADLKDTDYHTVDTTGLEEPLARSGIGSDSTVVFYGYAPALGFWLLKCYGHTDVRILDCSRQAWRTGGHPWSTTGDTCPPRSTSRSTACTTHAVTKSWAAEYGPAGVRVDAVSPGPTRTEGTIPMGDALDQLATAGSTRRVGQPEEIAAAIAFLATDQASFIHGVVLPMDGGRLAV